MNDYGLFQLIEDNRNHPDIDDFPKSFDELLPYAEKCRMMGYTQLADWLENWRLNLQFHIEREWDARPYTSTKE